MKRRGQYLIPFRSDVKGSGLRSWRAFCDVSAYELKAKGCSNLHVTISNVCPRVQSVPAASAVRTISTFDHTTHL